MTISVRRILSYWREIIVALFMLGMVWAEIARIQRSEIIFAGQERILNNQIQILEKMVAFQTRLENVENRKPSP